MKRVMYSIVAFGALSFAACNDLANSEENTSDSTTVSTGSIEMSTGSGGSSAMASYIDLKTGGSVRRDEASGRYVDESGNPVDIYVDVNSRDTFSATSGQIVNNALIHEGDNWRVDDTKIKIDGDEIKVKQGDDKIKMDGDEYKEKIGNTKVKMEDGETKVKTK
ncbi:MAG TPA: hypothetical protein PL009_01995 [Flavipsychrobacter sp.]|nr:hypothetical protein [Flavipsychrobacter sp.]